MSGEISAVAVASAVAGIASAGIGAVGAISSGEAASKSAAYQAQVAANNATIANQNAEYATQSGQAAATSQSLQNRAIVGAAISGAAANGLDVNSGSPSDVATSEREVGSLGVANTVENAALQAYGYRSQSTSYMAQSQLDTAQSQEALLAGEIGSAGDLLSGVSSVGSKDSSYQIQAQSLAAGAPSDLSGGSGGIGP